MIMMMMRYEFLGRSGPRVSEICLGTMSFGDAWGFGAGADESARVFSAYAEAGGNFIDTANEYHGGQTEEIVGGLIAGDRDRWVLATKYTFPHEFLAQDHIQEIVHGDQRDRIDLPSPARRG